jgi:succinate dehydrogenase / fumarate reductase cytochrome b subunit
VISFYRSTVGKKIIVAGTGLILLGFVIGHLLGNLQVFAGPEKINAYAAFLRKSIPLLWGTRLILLVSVVFHAVATIQLTRRNRESRSIPYEMKTSIQASAPSKSMIWGGLFLGFYILFHLSHLTVGVTHPQFSHWDVYSNIIRGFSFWPVSFLYVLGMVALGMHLYHGVFSVFQTFGVQHSKINSLRRPLASVVAVSISLGYIAIPVAVLIGFLH